MMTQRIVWRHSYAQPYSDVIFGLSPEDLEHERDLGLYELACWGDAAERKKNPKAIPKAPQEPPGAGPSKVYMMCVCVYMMFFRYPTTICYT